MTTGAPFFGDAIVTVRDDIVAAHSTYWERLAQPGSWWTGAERVAIAAEVRAARSCSLCQERKQALSPEHGSGAHDRAEGDLAALPDTAVEAVHRVTTDPARLSKRFVDQLASLGLDDARYVELLGIVVCVVAIDAFSRGVGVAPHPLPTPVDGSPDGYRPSAATDEGTFVPMVPDGGLADRDKDLWSKGTGNVVRALSLVPDAVRQMNALSAVHYVADADVLRARVRRTLSRPQIELVASRTSALNECFY